MSVHMYYTYSATLILFNAQHNKIVMNRTIVLNLWTPALLSAQLVNYFFLKC